MRFLSGLKRVFDALLGNAVNYADLLAPTFEFRIEPDCLILRHMFDALLTAKRFSATIRFSIS